MSEEGGRAQTVFKSHYTYAQPWVMAMLLDLPPPGQAEGGISLEEGSLQTLFHGNTRNCTDSLG